MHLLESYALQSGKKIDKIKILEKFYPLPFSKYITIHPYSKQSKTFDYWIEVLDIIFPLLQKENIQIVQIGAANEKPLPNCYQTQGNTNIGQVSYLIKNSLLHLSVDSFSAIFAAHYDIPLVALYSNNYLSAVKPFFGTKEKQILLEPHRLDNEKPSFSLEEHPKTINKIKPEKIAESICKLLNLGFNHPYKTLLIGNNYINTIVESLPNQIINPKIFGSNFMNIRMDFHFDENILAQQLQVCPCTIVTDKPITEDIIKGLRKNIKEVYYEIKEDNNPNFIKLLIKYTIPYFLYSYLSSEKLNPIKLNYMDFNLIVNREIKIPEILKDKDYNKIYYKSNKFTLSDGKIFTSYASLKNDIPAKSFQDNIHQIINSDDFWKEIEYLYLFEKID